MWRESRDPCTWILHTGPWSWCINSPPLLPTLWASPWTPNLGLGQQLPQHLCATGGLRLEEAALAWKLPSCLCTRSACCASRGCWLDICCFDNIYYPPHLPPLSQASNLVLLLNLRPQPRVSSPSLQLSPLQTRRRSWRPGSALLLPWGFATFSGIWITAFFHSVPFTLSQTEIPWSFLTFAWHPYPASSMNADLPHFYGSSIT